MQTYIKTLFIGFISLLPFVGKGQEIGITSRIEPGEIMIGEQAIIRLKIRTNDLDNTFLIIPPDTAIHRAEALAFRVTDTIELGGVLREIAAEMIITSFDSTLVEIPAFGIRVGNEERFSQPLFLKVSMPEVDMEHPEKFYGLKGNWALPYTWGELWILARPWVFGFILLIILVGLTYGTIRYRRYRLSQKARQPKEEEQLTELQRFQRDMNALKDRHLPEEGAVRLYYTELDNLLRRYIYRIVAIDSMEMTSRQLLHSLRKAGYESFVDEHHIERLMQHSDLGKFAKEMLTISDCHNDFDHCFGFIASLYHLKAEQSTVEKNEEEEGRERK